MRASPVPLAPFSACIGDCPRLLMFTGKGGVGKTTCSAAAGVTLAEQGKPTLLFSTDPAHSLSDSLGQQLGPRVQPIVGVPNLWGLEIDAAKVLSGFKQRFGDDLYDLITTATYLDDTDARLLLDLELPGLDELMSLHQILDFLTQSPQQFRHLVWDSAPTGHTLRLLELPELIDRWVRVIAQVTWRYRDVVFSVLPPADSVDEEGDLLLALKRTIRLFTQVIRDPKLSRLTPVTTLEPMVGSETLRLVARLRQLRIPVQMALINGIYPDNDQCSFCHTRHQLGRTYLEELGTKLRPLKLIGLPALPHPVRGVPGLRTLAASSLSDR